MRVSFWKSLVSLWLGLLAGCGSASLNDWVAAAPDAEAPTRRHEEFDNGTLAASERPNGADSSAAEPGLSTLALESTTAPTPSPRPEPARMRIYRASVDLLVGSVKDSLNGFVSEVEKAGGFLERRDNASITVRVPVDQFWGTLDKLKAMGTVLSESQSAEDVTQQYRDLELRMQTAETSRTRLLALLEKATDTKALLEIETEVRRLTEEIETMRATLKNLAQQVAYSTITATFRAAVPEVPRPRNSANRFPWLDRVGPEPMLRGF